MNADQLLTPDAPGDPKASRPLPAPAVECETAEKLASRQHAETLRKLDEMTKRLNRMEQSSRRSSLNVPTFWLALLAVAFSSFSVPWETVDERVTVWKEKAEKALKPHPRRVNSSVWQERKTSHEPELPMDPSAPLSDALLLLPRVNARPIALP